MAGHCGVATKKRSPFLSLRLGNLARKIKLWPRTKDDASWSQDRIVQTKRNHNPTAGSAQASRKSRSLFSGFATHRVARDEVAVVRLAVLELDQHGMALRRAQQRQRQLRTRREGATGRKIRARATVKPAAADAHYWRHAKGTGSDVAGAS